MEKETQEKIEQLELMQQNLQNFALQKQQFQTQFLEIESALKESEKTEDVYKIIGNIMVKVDKEELRNDLKSKKEMLDIRIKNIEKQESKIKERAESLQQEVMKEMGKGKKKTEKENDN